jgi:hypothetical protein
VEIVVALFLTALAIAITLGLVLIKLAWSAVCAVAASAWIPFEGFSLLVAGVAEALSIPLKVMAGLFVLGVLVVVIPLLIVGGLLLLLAAM